jgi:hypothetical protein
MLEPVADAPFAPSAASGVMLATGTCASVHVLQSEESMQEVERDGKEGEGNGG